MRWSALIVGALAAPAFAGPLVIAPTTVSIAAERRGAAVTVDNPGDEPVDLQFRAYGWTQADGADQLRPTDDLVISPAIATVPPHGRQLFRVLVTGDPPAPGAPERAWRLRLNQLPRGRQEAVAVNLEFLLPVFQGAADARPRLEWRPLTDGRVLLTNTGDRRAKLTALIVPGQSVPLAASGSSYLLSGASRVFTPAAPVPPGTGLMAASDVGTLRATPVALARR